MTTTTTTSKSFRQLSKNQKNILLCIEQSLADSGFPPTVREIAKATGIASTGSVNYNLVKLEEWGYIARQAGVSRGLRLVSDLPEKRPKGSAKPSSLLVLTIDLTRPREQVLADAREAMASLQAVMETLESPCNEAHKNTPTLYRGVSFLTGKVYQ